MAERINRVVILEDEPHNRDSLLRFISDRDDLNVVGFSEDGMECSRLCRTMVPDILFADIEVPSMNGLKVASLASELGSVVVFTTNFTSFALEAYRLGAAGYLTKPYSREEFNTVVDRAVLIAGASGGPEDAGVLLPDVLKRNYQLTPAQIEVCLLVLDGCSRNNLSLKLEKTERAVKSLLQGIYSRILDSNISEPFSPGRKDRYGQLVYTLCRLNR